MNSSSQTDLAASGELVDHILESSAAHNPCRITPLSAESLYTRLISIAATASTQKSYNMPANAEASSSKRHIKPYSKGANPKHKKGNQPQNRNNDTSKLGVSKIKSMIRQATRLLQKEKIEPGLKVQTERRLESLKADLKRAELGNVEKKNHEKYHMVSGIQLPYLSDRADCRKFPANRFDFSVSTRRDHIK